MESSTKMEKNAIQTFTKGHFFQDDKNATRLRKQIKQKYKRRPSRRRRIANILLILLPIPSTCIYRYQWLELMHSKWECIQSILVSLY